MDRPRIYATDTVYWTPLTHEGDRESIVDHADRFWIHPTDRPERTAQMLERDGLTLGLVDEDDGIIGYDTTVAFDHDLAEEMYRGRLETYRAGMEDAALVYHCVIRPDHRGRGLGVATAYLRQAILESDWDSDPAATYRCLYDTLPEPAPPRDLPDRAAPFVDALAWDTDAVISLPRRHETPGERIRGELSRAYRIARGYGFDHADWVDNGGTGVVTRRREDI